MRMHTKKDSLGVLMDGMADSTADIKSLDIRYEFYKVLESTLRVFFRREVKIIL